MDEPLDLDEEFIMELMQLVSSESSDTAGTTSSDSEPSFKPVDRFVTELKDEWHAEGIRYPGTVKRQPKRVRKGRRKELLELRTQVATYKKTLASLLAHKHDKSSVKFGNFWQRTAHRIALEKRLALRENEQLRSLAGYQMTTIKELQRSILTTIGNSKSLDVSQLEAMRPKASTSSCSNPQLMATSKAKSPVRRIQLEVECVDNRNFACIWMEDEATIPMNFALAASSAWTILLKGRGHYRPDGLVQRSDGPVDFVCGSVKVKGCNDGSQVTLRKYDAPLCVTLVWEMTFPTGKETGSVRYEPSLENSNSCICVSRVQFSPRPLEEGGEAAAIGNAVSMYDNSIGSQCKAVLASLHDQAALLSTISAQVTY